MIIQGLVQRQQPKILPQQIRLLNIFHLTSLELDQHIKVELEENPFLEEQDSDKELKEGTGKQNELANWEEMINEDIPDYQSEYCNYFPAERIPEQPIPEELNFREMLKEQLRLEVCDEKKYLLGNYLIDSLNDGGLLDVSLDEVCDHISLRERMKVNIEDLEEVLLVIQRLDPPGVGARSIRESYLLQLKRLDQNDPSITLAGELLLFHYPELINHELGKICSSMNISERELRSVLSVLAGLQLRPLTMCNNLESMKETIIPDFILIEEDGVLRVEVCNERSAAIGINKAWIEKLHACKEKKDQAGLQYLKRKMQGAEWFVGAIRQRENTMLRIMKAILAIQARSFISGDRMELRPMILKDVADLAGLDISTVSRITCNKYVSTPFGQVLLKSLFSEGLMDLMGRKVSASAIRELLKQTIENENKRRPYTDYQLMNKLAQRGFKLARRTIAKYREMLKLPTAQMRAIWG